MLETLAFDYVNQSELMLRAISFGMVILGGLLAAATIKVNGRLARPPYFAAFAGLLLLVIVAQFVWLDAVDAVAHGYLGILMLVDLISSLLLGFALCPLAMARSLDAVGHRRMAVLAFIPLANLVLLFWPSDERETCPRSAVLPGLKGWVGVVAGLVLLAGAATAMAVLTRQIGQQVALASDPQAQAAWIGTLIDDQGLEATLADLVESAPIPIAIDEATTMTKAEADGTHFRRTYTVSIDIDGLPDGFAGQVASSLCTNPLLRELLDAGASIHEIYLRTDGSLIDEVVVTKGSCA
jgi:hypothetical protein